MKSNFLLVTTKASLGGGEREGGNVYTCTLSHHI